jgi:putative protease
VFVHGALCIAYSGRCLLSGYFNHRDPNQGTCTNSCRWDYQVHDAVTDASGDVQGRTNAADAGMPGSGDGRRAEAQKVYLLEQREHAGDLMPIEEDEHGTYIMNSKDLRAVEHIAELVRIGVDSLKIEGRTKSPYYIARTTQAYRRAIDDAVAGRPFDTRLLAELENLANRGYTDGFYVRHHTQDYQNYIKGASSGERQQYVGEVDGYDAATGLAEIDVKNKIRVGDRLELITPQGNRRFVLEHMEGRNGVALDEAPGGGHRVRIPLPAGDYRFALLAKEL